MTYAMTLDHSWEIMSEEEMYDVNGGDSLNFARNVYGMLEMLAISQANRTAWGIPGIATLATWSYWYAAMTFPIALGKIAAFTGNPIVIGIAALGGVAAVTYLWNVRVFY